MDRGGEDATVLADGTNGYFDPRGSLPLPAAPPPTHGRTGV